MGSCKEFKGDMDESSISSIIHLEELNRFFSSRGGVPISDLTNIERKVEAEVYCNKLFMQSEVQIITCACHPTGDKVRQNE